jgi:riboflavin kinase/FMN adenylyltransferase
VPDVFRSLQEVPAGYGPSVVTIGNFDGVHLGHARILGEVVRIARRSGRRAAALTFDPHPTRVVAPERAPQLLATVETRIALLVETGLDAVLVLPFTPQVAQLEPEEFVRQMLVDALGARAVVVGQNFRFGRRQAGNVEVLRELGRRMGYEVHIVEPVCRRGEAVSSSQIRRWLREGRVERARRLLGRPFALEGRVVRGHGVGSRRTVPTLNLAPDTEMLPARGVYITCTFDPAGGRRWPSVTNIGYRPTFDGADLSVETHLLRPLDGPDPERLSLAFCRRLREERKFASPEDLRAQILRDVDRTETYFRRLRAAQLTKEKA